MWFIRQRDMDTEQTAGETEHSNSHMVYTAERLGHWATALEKRITTTHMWFIQ